MTGDWTFPFCPLPPDWTVNWKAIQRRFAWVAALAGVPQDAAYHAEGDVWIHTRMVAEALTRLDAWRALEAGERATLFASALLHDVAKPACTRTEPDGRITSHRHARVGAQMARYLLWRGEGLDAALPFLERETIARLVRFHGLPLWFLEKDDPQRAVLAAAESANLAHVALLAEADVRGRICADQHELLDRIALFRSFCAESNCFTNPYPFASDQSRFVYFHHRAHSDPSYAAYNDTTFEVTLLSGLPGAGKDTWIRAHRPGWPVIALDAIRREMGVAPTDAQGAVAQEAKARARELMRQRQSFVWNATNTTRTMRSQLVDLFASYGARITIVYLDAPYETLFQRNASRREHEQVPETVIHRLMRKLDVPDTTEAHHVEWVYA
jgi:predicted kinase